MFYLPLGLIRRRDEPRDRARDRVMQHAVPQATTGQGSGCLLAGGHSQSGRNSGSWASHVWRARAGVRGLCEPVVSIRRRLRVRLTNSR